MWEFLQRNNSGNFHSFHGCGECEYSSFMLSLIYQARMHFLVLVSCLFDSTCFGVCRNLSDVLWEAISTRQIVSLYQGLGTKNLQSFIAQFVYFYGYSCIKRLYLERSGFNSIGTKANLILAAAAGACTAIVTQVRLIWGRPVCCWLIIISHFTIYNIKCHISV